MVNSRICTDGLASRLTVRLRKWASIRMSLRVNSRPDHFLFAESLKLLGAVDGRGRRSHTFLVLVPFLKYIAVSWKSLSP